MIYNRLGNISMFFCGVSCFCAVMFQSLMFIIIAILFLILQFLYSIVFNKR